MRSKLARVVSDNAAKRSVCTNRLSDLTQPGADLTARYPGARHGHQSVGREPAPSRAQRAEREGLAVERDRSPGMPMAAPAENPSRGHLSGTGARRSSDRLLAWPLT